MAKERPRPQPRPAVAAERHGLSGPARPDDALIPARHRADALIHELLHAFTLVGFGRVDVALGIGRDAVHAVELTRLTAAVAECGELLERLAQNDAYALVLAVGHDHVSLARIPRERDVPHGAGTQGIPGVERLLHELAFCREDLQPVVLAVTDVDQPVIGALDAMDRVAELLRRRRLRIVRPEIGI